MTTMTTTRCEDCGTRVQTALGSDSRYPMGVKTATGYICGPCMAARHGVDEVERDG